MAYAYINGVFLWGDVMRNGYAIRPYLPGDEEGCLDLYNYVFPQQMTAYQWRWLNDDNPAGVSIIETAWDKNRLMGFYGLIPMKFYAAGKTIKGALSGIAVTHPDYRYGGVFSSLGKEAYKRAEMSGIEMIYGFPTEHSRHGMKKNLGWDFIQQGQLITGRGLAVSDGGTYTTTQKEELFGQELDFIWNRLAEGALRSSILVARDREYLEWRFQSCPAKGYSIIIAEDRLGPSGYMVVRPLVISGEQYCHIDDVAAADINSFRKMVKYMAEYYGDTVFYQARLSEDSPFYRCAIGMGFRESGIKYYFGSKLMKKKLTAREYQWYFTMADSPEFAI
ncbi:MAG: hypothetical protein VR68_07920 [Peptococcaceae bacterium BRH_c4a]|nr:MAG: hypothetical protein VR68_07920 [Peptococcaceae bacterium BRH_c4a]